MNIISYYNKYKYVYGVSSVFMYEWKHTVYKFINLDDAFEWLATETYMFAERELCSRAKAIKIAGKKNVDNYEIWRARNGN